MPTSQEGNNMILASADADSKVRILAVKELVNSIDGKDLTEIDDIVSLFFCVLLTRPKTTI